jgi:hypothetical protein
MGLFEQTKYERELAIAQLRKKVLNAYSANPEQYEKLFARLHDLRMDHMAQNYREIRGLPPNAKTPYCGTRWT